MRFRVLSLLVVLFTLLTTPLAAGGQVDPEAEIRGLLADYKRAIESKDLLLFQRIRPGLSAAEIRRVRVAFEQSRSVQVDLNIQRIDVTSDTAKVYVERQHGEFVPYGEPVRDRRPVVFWLRRTAEGWVIESVGE